MKIALEGLLPSRRAREGIENGRESPPALLVELSCSSFRIDPPKQ